MSNFLFFVIKKACNMVDTRMHYFNAKEAVNKSNYFHTSLSQLIAYCSHQHEVICVAQARRCDHLCQVIVKHSSVPEKGRKCILRNFASDSKLKGNRYLTTSLPQSSIEEQIVSRTTVLLNWQMESRTSIDPL